MNRDDLFSWSVFAEKLNVDFSGFAWIRKEGNVLIDPVAMSEHDAAHLASLGGAAWIVVTNSDHIRDTVRSRPSSERRSPARRKRMKHFRCGAIAI